jgi:Concanavalin A-like lectin/glucanases superfamily/Domain of unknown function (DUF2341)/PEGA domain
MTWYNNSWNYRKAITISNSGSALSDYQTLVTVDTASLVAASKMRSDCGDTRFVDTNDSTLLNYWIESGQNSSSTKIWVKIPSIATGSKTIYMYYGNPSATVTSITIPTFISEISGVVGAWDLNGDALDRSGQGGNGSTVGITYVGGKFGQAANFDGTGYIQIADSVVNSPSTNVSLVAWIYPHVINNVGGIVSKFNYASGNFRSYGYYLHGNGVEVAISHDGIGAITNNSAAITINNWYLAVLTFDGTNVKNYLNSNSPVISSYPGTIFDSSDYFYIGSYNGISYKFDGLIEHVRLYNRAISSSEILDLYGTGGDRVGLITSNYAGKELVRKYASPEPTFSISGSEEALGSLNISSTPSGAVGAAIYIDGNVTPSGVTPLIVTSFTPGTHTYRLTKTGYTEIPATNFNITSGQTTTISQAMLTVANIGTTLMTITPSENPCRTVICTVLVSVTWVNSGQTAGSSNLSITVSGGTPTITQPVYSSVSFAANGTNGDTIMETFTVSGLSAGTHSICPNPN